LIYFILECLLLAGSLTESVKSPFYGGHDRNRMVLVQLPPSSHCCVPG